MSGGALSSRRSAAAATIAGAVDTASISFDQNGLIPCIVQDWATRRGADARVHERAGARATRETGELHLCSRSRSEHWHKGATAGNVAGVRALRLDCDGDALLALVEPAGPACHTGERTCFHQRRARPAGAVRDAAGAGAHHRRARARAPAGSYTVELLDDPAAIGEKVDGGGRGGRARRPRGVGRAGRRRGGRRALPPARAAAQPRTSASRMRERAGSSGAEASSMSAARESIERRRSHRRRAERDSRLAQNHSVVPLRTASSRTARRRCRRS